MGIPRRGLVNSGCVFVVITVHVWIDTVTDYRGSTLMSHTHDKYGAAAILRGINIYCSTA